MCRREKPNIANPPIQLQFFNFIQKIGYTNNILDPYSAGSKGNSAVIQQLTHQLNLVNNEICNWGPDKKGHKPNATNPKENISLSKYPAT